MCEPTYFPSGLDAVQHGHTDVENYQIELWLPNLLKCLLAVFGFAANSQGVPGKKRPDTTPYSFIVVGN
jgi:hypothetical protein